MLEIKLAEVVQVNEETCFILRNVVDIQLYFCVWALLQGVWAIVPYFFQ